ncbi:C-3 sterol dehydrogenase/C-4 decarboxylase [Diplocarpon rosae]|nr:C-3 sterol dehydrogenase/C-4 decarboxylase [Diplocarpon rosae]
MASLEEEQCSSETPSPVISTAPSCTFTRISSFEQLPTSGSQLGNVLVVGGCGFLGHHVVKFLLKESTCGSITVMCRSPFKNLYDGVNYEIGDITNLDHVRHVVRKSMPKVIINTASPHAYKDHELVPNIFKVNINGNQNLLQAAVETGTVQVYVYTSSAPIVASPGGCYDHADETTPTLAEPKLIKGDPYHVAKAFGDKIVREANGKHGILTCCIRPTALYGEGDGQMIGPVIKALEDGNTGVWMGYNDVEMDVVYVGHVAIAHILAAKGVLTEKSDPYATKISGEAFNITDDQPSPPLTFFRKFWALAGDERPLSTVWYIPPPMVLIMAHMAEWFVWATTWGKLRPQDLILERMEFILYTRTYSIKKAREKLGFVPWKDQPYANQDAALKGAMECYLSSEYHGPVKTLTPPSWPAIPFKLISETGALTMSSIPPSHHCITAARYMAQTHNTIFRALNSIYHHALLVSPGTDEAASLLAYCAITYEFMHHHQIIEEQVYFPAIEAASGITGLMSENVTQHLAMELGMEAFRRYAENTRKGEFSGEKLRDLIMVFKDAYEKHQHEEITTILELGGKVESAVMKECDMLFRRESERQSDVYKAAPFVLSAQDRTFVFDSSTSHPYLYKNPISRFFIPIFVYYCMYGRHASAWAFAPSTARGQPKPLPSQSRTGEKGRGEMGQNIDGIEIYEKALKMGVGSAWRWVEELREAWLKPSWQIVVPFAMIGIAWLLFA